MNRRSLALAVAMILVAAFAYAADKEPVRWLNVHVTEAGDDTEVDLRLPLSMVMTVLDSIKTDRVHGGKVSIELDSDTEIDWVAILAELRRAPEGQYVKVRDRNADALISKRGGMVLIDVEARGAKAEKVQVRLPEALLEAFVIDAENRIDVKAFLSGLREVGAGELLRVTSADANVRIWVE